MPWPGLNITSNTNRACLECPLFFNRVFYFDGFDNVLSKQYIKCSLLFFRYSILCNLGTDVIAFYLP